MTRRHLGYRLMGRPTVTFWFIQLEPSVNCREEMFLGWAKD
jgi:hypothetical protein